MSMDSKLLVDDPYAVTRYPDLTYHTRDDGQAKELLAAFWAGQPVMFRHPTAFWHGMVLVRECKSRPVFCGLTEYDFVLRPTGRPIADREIAALTYPESKYDDRQEALRYIGHAIRARILGVDWGIESHPNCRCLPLVIERRGPVKIRNRFYVAAPSVTTPSEQDQDNVAGAVALARKPMDRSGKWTRKDLAAAIEHGEQLLADDPTKDHVAIVKIVKIVRRPKPKFIVDDVK